MIATTGPGQNVPAVGVIIVNFNAEGLILDAVGSILAQTLRPHRIVVVDNASTDESAAAVSATYPGVTLIQLDENSGFAAANNVGIAMLGDCEFIADVRGSVPYKRELMKVYVRRALREALDGGTH